MAPRTKRPVRLDRIKPRVRSNSEFLYPTTGRHAPKRSDAAYVWDLQSIRAARDCQMIGKFDRPVQLAAAMRTDAALFNAFRIRLDALSSVGTELRAAPGERGAAVARKAAVSCFAPMSVLRSLHGTLANHGLSIGHIVREPTEDGTRVDMRLEEWPLQHVTWRESERLLYTAVQNCVQTPIVHGDGEWIIVRKTKEKPWRQDAAILPGALVWGALANGVRDWAGAGRSHGNPKVMGELPAGVAMARKDGTMTAEATEFLRMLQNVVSGFHDVGIRPAGAKTDVLYNGSQAWQIFQSLIDNREKAAARIYLGTDAILGSNSGGPGVDISELFDVASQILQSDVSALEQALRTGLYEPWAAVNEGDSRYAPSLIYNLPDPDEAQSVEREDKKDDALFNAIDRRKTAGMMLEQTDVDALARRYGVSNSPKLAPATERAVPLALAPTDSAKTVRVREARAAQGLPPLGDARDDKLLPELDTPAATPPTGAPAPAPAPALTRLAGEYDENKHPRADDGKFGAGGGGAPESDAPKDGSDDDGEGDEPPLSPHEQRQRKRQASVDRVAEIHQAKAPVREQIDSIDADDAQDNAAIAEHAHQATATIVRSKKEMAVGAAKAREQSAALKAEAKALKSKPEESYVDDTIEPRMNAARATEKALRDKAAASSDPATRASYNAAADVHRKTANELELYSMSPRTTHDVADDKRDEARDLDRAVKNEPRLQAKLDEAHAAIQRGDFKAAERARRTVERSSVSDVLAPNDTPASEHVADHINDSDFTSPVHPSDMRDRAKERAALQEKHDRLERAQKVHEKRIGQIDADGDGRTGTAEEQDDKPPAALAGNYDEGKHPRADDGKFGQGGGGAPAPAAAPHADPAAKAAKRTADFDTAGKRANEVANAGGHGDSVRSFLNVERHRVSKDERAGVPNATSDATTAFLHDARKNGADFKGTVFRGTSQAELDQIKATGSNKGTWSVDYEGSNAAKFSKKSGVLLVVKHGSGAIPVDHIDGSNTYNEALVPKGTKFKVTGERTNAAGIKVVNLEPVDGDGDGKVNE